jgi:general stress protein YciG
MRKAVTLKEHAQRIAPLGGRASMENRTAEERQEFARSGGQAGGAARAKKLSAKRRKEIAAKAAAARWGKK